MTLGRDPDEDDFRALVARYASALGRLVRHYEARHDAQRDLEQDILVALWRARPNFRGEGSERAWVYRIAHNVAASHVARALRTRRGTRIAADAVVPPSPPLPDDTVDDRTKLRRMDECVQRFDLLSRQLILLALEGCSSAEIAAVTGLSPTNVTTRLSRLRKQLAEQVFP